MACIDSLNEVLHVIAGGDQNQIISIDRNGEIVDFCLQINY